MQHAAVVPGLVTADSIFFFQHDDSGAGKPLAQAVRGRQAHNASADDDDSLQIHFFECNAALKRTAPFSPFRQAPWE